MKLLSFITLCSFLFRSTFSLSCRDESNNEVDWFVALKLPLLHPFSDGHSYLYTTNKTQNETEFKKSRYSVLNNQSIMGLTFNPIYKLKDNISYVLYNDEHPDGKTTFRLGHTKGVIAVLGQRGFVLMHSVPKFPPSPLNSTGYSYPLTGLRYGQSLLCISINADAASMRALAKHLLHNQPYYYSRHLTEEFIEKHPYFSKITSGRRKVMKPYYHVGQLKSKLGHNFTLISKSSKFDDDLYKDLVSNVLDSDLLVESWPNGRDRVASDCRGEHKVNNVETLRLSGVNFTSHHDHSKWVLAKNNRVCIGDINRMGTQYKRAGGTACFRQAQVAKCLNKAVLQVEPCKKPLVAFTRLVKGARDKTIRLWFALLNRNTNKETQSPIIDVQ